MILNREKMENSSSWKSQRLLPVKAGLALVSQLSENLDISDRQGTIYGSLLQIQSHHHTLAGTRYDLPVPEGYPRTASYSRCAVSQSCLVLLAGPSPQTPPTGHIDRQEGACVEFRV